MRQNPHDRLQMHRKLLSPWEKVNEQEWLPFKDIIAKTAEQGLNRRTVMRHLKNKAKFEQDPRGYNRIFYRPTQGFWGWILHESLQTVDSFEEERIVVWMKAKDVIDKQFDKLQEWYFEDYKDFTRAKDGRRGHGSIARKLQAIGLSG
jgi:hypothetical protein